MSTEVLGHVAGRLLIGWSNKQIRSRKIQGPGEPAMTRWIALKERIPKLHSASLDFVWHF